MCVCLSEARICIFSELSEKITCRVKKSKSKYRSQNQQVSWALFVPFLGNFLAETDDFYIDGRVSRRRIHRCKNRLSPPRESRGKEGKQITNIRTISLFSSGFPWRRRTIFTSMDPSSRDASIDVKIVRLRQGNPEEWGKESQRETWSSVVLSER